MIDIPDWYFLSIWPLIGTIYTVVALRVWVCLIVESKKAVAESGDFPLRTLLAFAILFLATAISISWPALIVLRFIAKPEYGKGENGHDVPQDQQ